MAKLRRSDTRKKARRDYRKTRRAAKKVGGWPNILNRWFSKKAPIDPRNISHDPITGKRFPPKGVKSIRTRVIESNLVEAAEMNDLDKVKSILSRDIVDPNITKVDNFDMIKLDDGIVVTPLIYAIKHSNPHMVYALFTIGSKKADPTYPCSRYDIKADWGDAVICPEKIAKDIYNKSPTKESYQVLYILDRAIDAHFNRANKQKNNKVSR
jgi:hypothetical protein